MFYLKKFANSTAYRAYLASDEQWRPSVAYVVNQHPENIGADGKDANMNMQDWYKGNTPLTQDSSRYVDFQDLGQHFIEVFNNGTMYYWAMKDATRIIGGNTTQVGTFDASVDESGSLNISVPTDTSTVDGSAWYTMDASTGELNFWNFPEYKSGTYTWKDVSNNTHTAVVP